MRICFQIVVFLFSLRIAEGQIKARPKINRIMAPFGFTFGQTEKEFYEKSRASLGMPGHPFMEPGFRDMRRIVFPVLAMPMGPRKASVYGLLLNNKLCQVKIFCTEDSLLLMKELIDKWGRYSEDTTLENNRKGYRWKFDDGYLLLTSEASREFYLTYQASDLYQVQLKVLASKILSEKADSPADDKPRRPSGQSW